MKILYDYSAFVMQARGGVSRVLYELFRHISILPEIECRLFAGFHRNQYLRDAPEEVKKKIIGWYLPPSIVKQRIFMPINRVLFKFYARKFRPDICHYTYFDTPDVPEGCKVVITMHDMIHELYPDMFGADDPQHGWKLNAVARADGIVCVSENTKTDLERLFDVAGKRIEVVYHGNSLESIEPERSDMPNPYLLYVGTRAVGYKNFEFVLQALSQQERNFEMHLVCFGGGALTDAEQHQIELLGLADRIRQVGGSDTVLAGFYKKAHALIYPSKYEGFGLPPIEAMGLNCPVLASKAPPMPEIIGDAGLYFDPEITSELNECLKIIEKDSIRGELVRKGAERVLIFSWGNVAQEALTFYKSLVWQMSRPCIKQ